MISKGCLKILPFGDKEIACISQKDAWNCVTECLKNDINFYLEKPFIEDELTKVYVMNKNGNRVTHC